MNIKTQCCGLILLLVMGIIYSRKKTIRLSTSRVFICFFAITFLCILLDIASVFAIVRTDLFSETVKNIICKLYLISIVLTALWGLAYVCVEIYAVGKERRRVLRVAEAVAGIGSLTICLLPLYSTYDQEYETVYTHGPGAITTYVLALSMMLVSVVLIFINRSKMNRSRREAIQIWILLWILAAVIQFFVPQLLIVGNAAAIGIMVLYLKFENPESNIEHKTGFFNQSALYRYIREFNHNKQDFSLLYIDIGINVYDTLKGFIADYLDKIPNVTKFALTQDEIILLFRDKNYAEEVIKKLLKRFEEGWGKGLAFYLQPNWIYLENAALLREERDYFYLLHRIKSNELQYVNNHFVRVDEETVALMYKDREREHQLSDAMDANRVEVFYQPIYSVKEQRIVSAEALVRIRDEEGHIVYPSEFIDVAEKNNMILKLGRMVFEQICIFIKNHDMDELGLHCIDVNLSVIQCSYQSLAQEFIEIMEKYQVNPKYINLEITETASVNAKQRLLENMKRLMDYGVIFSLDDFGTGQSNLDYMLDMPVNIIKFDRELINAYFESSKAKYILEAVLQMIQGMNLQTISEGIETKEQLDMMEKLGVDYIQGYYFSKPFCEKDFLEYITSWK